MWRDFQRAGVAMVLLAQGLVASLSAQEINHSEVVVLDVVLVVATNQPAALPQHLPQSVTPVSAAQVAAAGVDSALTLARMIPNLSLAHTRQRSYADTYALRGIANTEFLSDPAVVFYVDDVPFGDVAGYTTDLLAIDRVEVFRGPQGTRFGKNAEAGVINIVTRQPTDRFEAEGKTSAASFNTWLAQAATSVPLVTNKLFLHLAGQYATSDGFIRNTFLGTDADPQESFNGRATLQWILSDQWRMDFTATADRFDDGVSLTPLGGNFRQTASDFPGKYHQSVNSQALRVRGEWEGLALTSVTARREFNLDPFQFDPDFSPITGNTGVNTWVQTQWTEEMRVRPLAPPDHWDGHAGFFFSASDSDVRRLFDFAFPPPGGSGSDVVIQQQQFYTYALFGEVTRTLQDRFDVTLGLRLEYADRRWQGTRTSTLGPPSPPLDEAKGYFNATPKLTLAYHFTDDVMLYGSTGLGFKPGGYSVVVNDPALREFDTEHLWASELGLKSSWLEGKLIANAALFYYDVNDYQVEQFGPALSVTVANASRARSLGAELELTWRPRRVGSSAVSSATTKCAWTTTPIRSPA